MKLCSELFALSNSEKIAIAVVLLFALAFFKPVVSGDGVGYYVVLEGAVRDHTFNLSNQLHYNEVFNGTAVFFFEGSKQYVSQYAPGMALLSSPFYAASLVLDDFAIFHIKDAFFLQERGDILIHQLGAIAAPVLLFICALLFSLVVVRELKLKNGWVALLLAFFGTPIIRYATYDLYYTHVVEAGLMAMLVYCIVKRKPVAYWGALVGLLTMVRYTSVLYLLPIGLYLLWQKRQKDLVPAFAGFVPFVLAILAYFTLAYGSPFTSGYAASGALAGNFNWNPLPGLFTVLFSTQSGLLLWSPVVLLAIFGLWCWKDDRKWLLLGVLAVMTLVNSVFFQGTTGYSFSNRYYSTMFSIFALGLAILIKQRPRYLPLVIVLSAYGCVLFILSLAGVFSTFPTLELIWNYWVLQQNIFSLPSLLFEKLGIVRVFLER